MFLHLAVVYLLRPVIVAKLAPHVGKVVHHAALERVLGLPVAAHVKPDAPAAPVLVAQVELHADVWQQEQPVHGIGAQGDAVGQRQCVSLRPAVDDLCLRKRGNHQGSSA